MYKLKSDIIYNHLFQQIGKCKGDVFFLSKNGDTFNLKSIFSRFIFVTFLTNKELLKNGQLHFDFSDLPLLEDYVEEVNDNSNKQ